MKLDRLRRREFIALLGCATSWPLAARAQQAGKMPTIGFLGAATPEAASQWVAAFLLRLREVGWIEGRTVAIEYRWAEGRAARATEIAAEFVRLKVNIIVTYGTPAAVAAKQATSTIPIVFATAADPVGTGLVENLARPGGNVTGSSVQQPDLAAKRLELLHELLPALRRLAVLANVASPNAAPVMQEVGTAASALGLDVIPFEVRRGEDIVTGFDAIKQRAEAMYIVSTPLIFTYRTRIHTLAMSMRLPTIYDYSEFVEAGGLMSLEQTCGTSFAARPIM
jgi:putative ABC transport system substrate-binding protein